jgi:D-xylose 1-dehydrogenase (NADP+, D-xylono-1,5-lactone-forming)
VSASAGAPSGVGVLGIGVLGASSMIHTAVMRDAILAVDGVALVHEASRALSGADGEAVDDVRRSTDYRAVLDDPAVDLVYVPLPNHLHEEWVLACAEVGKHVLCEKPLAVDAPSARRMASACASAGVVLLEAYMSPFHPRSAAVQAAVARGEVGEVVHGEARMSGVLPADNHRWSVANGGGALLDVGIYCLEPILMAFGWDGAAPVSVAASARLGGDGVDSTLGAMLAFSGAGSSGDRILQLWVSFEAPDQQRLAITGLSGSIEVTRHATPDRRDSGYDLRALDGSVTHVSTDTGDCYEGLIAHVRDVVRGDAVPLRDVDRSIAVAELLDQIAVAADLPSSR